MGCAVSKLDDSPLLSLCLERKELIKAAADCRYALASSHNLYIQALLDVGEALSRFVDDAVVISVDPPQTSVSKEGGSSDRNSDSDDETRNSEFENLVDEEESPVSVSNDELLGEDSHLVFPPTGSDSDSELGSLPSDDFDEMEMLSLSPVMERVQTGAASKVSYKRSSMEAPSTVYEYQRVFPVTVHWQESLRGAPGYHQYENEASSSSAPMNAPLYGFRHPQDGYRASAPAPAPANLPPHNLMRPQDRNRASFDVPLNLPQEDPYQGLRFPWYGNEMPLGVSVDMRHHVPRHSQVDMQNAPSASFLSPQSELANWDYINPFSLVEDVFRNYYSQDRNVPESSSNIPDLREVRHREGIPDLEDVKEQNPAQEALEEIQVGGHAMGCAGDGSSTTVMLNTQGVASAVGRKSELNVCEDIELDSDAAEKGSADALESTTPDEENAGRKEKSSEEGEAFTHKDESPGSSHLTTSAAHGSRDLQEVVKAIKGGFNSTFNCGREISKVLEGGKLPYQYTGTGLKVISSWIWGCVIPSAPTHLPSRQSSFRSFKIATANKEDLEMVALAKAGNLSSTLERLSVWEKKLLEEAKGEEKLRVVYDRESKRLKDLGQKGAESSKIEVAIVSIKKLLLKINVTMTSVHAVSRRIHKLRDEELLPQLSELIHGFIWMWMFMMKCHQKQLQDLLEAKTHVQVASSGITGHSSLKATLKLEMECMKWAKCFEDWINTQKSFVKLLNGWLLKCICQEQEETADGIAPFSPGRVGAPSTFIICHDWYQAVERMSESRVSQAIRDFALSLHQLWEKQGNEHRQRLKAEYLSKDYQRRVKSFHHERGTNWSSNATTSDNLTESGVPLMSDDLEFMKKRLEEENVKHGEAMKQVNNAASSSFKSGMISILEALERFCLETLRGYEQIRIPNMGGNTGAEILFSCF